MRKTTILELAISLLCLSSCTKQPVADTTAPAVSVAPAADVALLAEWTGPHGGVPAFDRMELGQLEPATKAAMDQHLAELDAIAADPAPPTFENTIVAMERSGRAYQRVETYYGIWSSNLSTPEFREIDERLAPLDSEYRSKIVQNTALFARVKAVHDSPQLASRSPAEQRLVKLVYDRFARRGATLTGADKERYAAIERRLAELHTAFGNNVLADEEGTVHVLEEAQLAGLPASLRAAAAAEAEARGMPGKYVITNTRSSMDPFLTYAEDRGLREKVWRAYYDRGDNGDEHDNNAIITEILQLRDERVGLLGYDD